MAEEKVKQISKAKPEDRSTEFVTKLKGIEAINGLLSQKNQKHIDFGLWTADIAMLVWLLAGELQDLKDRADKGEIVI